MHSTTKSSSPNFYNKINTHIYLHGIFSNMLSYSGIICITISFVKLGQFRNKWIIRISVTAWRKADYNKEKGKKEEGRRKEGKKEGKKERRKERRKEGKKERKKERKKGKKEKGEEKSRKRRDKLQ
jgi:hypothetical protein